MLDAKRGMTGSVSFIRAIGFDVGGVIFPDLDTPIVGPMAQELGISSELVSKFWEEVYLKLAVGKEGTEDELWRKIKRASKKEISTAELRKRYRKFLVPDGEVVSLIKKLGRNYSLLLVTNTIQEWLDYELNHFQLRPLFSALVASFEAGARKPRQKFFKFLVKKLKFLNCLPGECVFIDDNEKNIHAAQELGFQTIFFKNLPSLKSALRKHGVNF